MKRNKKIWRGWTPCKKCNGRKTYGGIKILFGLFRLKKWKHSCKCNNVVYEGKTEIDKEKCEEVLRKQKEQKDDKRNNN